MWCTRTNRMAKTMTEQIVYKIAKWSETFETADSRRHKSLHWISIPLGFNSNGYAKLIEEFGDEAPAIYGAWIALANIAATCPIRGILSTSSGDALTVGRLSFISHFPSTVFGKLLDWASKDSVGWLEKMASDEIKRLLLDCESINNQSPNELPDKTRQDLTKPNTTRPDQTKRSSVGRSSNGGVVAVAELRVLSDDELLAVQASEIESLCRRINRDLPFTIPPKTLGRLGRIAIAAGVRSQVLELVRSVASGTVRNPKRYWEAALTKMLAEAGVDYQGSMAKCEALAKEQVA